MTRRPYLDALRRFAHGLDRMGMPRLAGRVIVRVWKLETRR